MLRIEFGIYPLRLYIALSEDILKEDFTTLVDFDNSYRGIVEKTTYKALDEDGILVRFRKLEDINSETIAHEAVHVATLVYEYIGSTIYNNNDEPFAYLVGFVAKKFEEFKENKKKILELCQ